MSGEGEEPTWLTAELLGYADKLSARPGETVRFMVSAAADRFRAEIVRLEGLSAGWEFAGGHANR